MPPVTPARARHRTLHIWILFIAAIIAIYALCELGFFAGIFTGSSSVEFVSAHAAATYRSSGASLVPLSTGITSIGPMTGEGGYAVSAALTDPPQLTQAEASSTGAIWPPVIIAPIQPVWTMTAGGAAAGSGRPLGVAKSGAVLALTPSGLVALSASGSTTLVATEASDLVGALSSDASLAAVKNPATSMIDLYALGASAQYLGSVELYNPVAVAFLGNSRLLLLTTDEVVSSYTVRAGQAPAFIATSTLPNPWP